MKPVKLLLLLLPMVLVYACRRNDEGNPQAPSGTSIYLSPHILNDPSSGHLLVLDSNGDTLSDHKTTTEALNFRKWRIGGATRYTYLEHNYQAYHIPGVGYVPGWVIVLDENFNELKRISLLPYNGRTAADPNALDLHDFILIDDNHYIAMAYYEKKVNNIPPSLSPVNDCRVVSCIIQEVENGAVTREWDGTDYPEFYTSSVEGNSFSDTASIYDYMHLNSIAIDESDQNLVCSMRNVNQVIKINRTTGAIMWRLGGPNSDFFLTSSLKFLRQHDVTFTDEGKTLLMLDNGAAGERDYSRVLEFRLNESNHTIESYKSTTLPGNIFAGFMGSVQKRGDNYFVCCGSTKKMLEFNSITGEILYEQALSSACYRAYKIDE
jgi:arylsulfate sulfotransferase